MAEENKTIQTEDKTSADKTNQEEAQAQPLATPKRSEGGPAKDEPATAPAPPEPTEQTEPEITPAELEPKQAIELEQESKALEPEKTEQTEEKQPEVMEELIAEKPEPLDETKQAKTEAAPLPPEPTPSQAPKTPPPAPSPIAQTAPAQLASPAKGGLATPVAAPSASVQIEKNKPKPPPAPISAKASTDKPPVIESFITKFRDKLTEFRKHANQKRSEKVKENLDKIMDYALKTQKVVNDDVERLINIRDRQALRYLKKLTKQGKLIKFGKKRNTFYKPIKK